MIPTDWLKPRSCAATSCSGPAGVCGDGCEPLHPPPLRRQRRERRLRCEIIMQRQCSLLGRAQGRRHRAGDTSTDADPIMQRPAVPTLTAHFISGDLRTNHNRVSAYEWKWTYRINRTPYTFTVRAEQHPAPRAAAGSARAPFLHCRLRACRGRRAMKPHTAPRQTRRLAHQTSSSAIITPPPPRAPLSVWQLLAHASSLDFVS